MPVGFGFSVGDFLAALELVGTVIDALRESSHAGTNFQSLIQELYALETALLHIKRLDLDESQHADQVALQNAACQCQRTIDAFYAKVRKYQPHLRDGGTNSRLRDGWAKIKWAVCRQEDVDTFRAEIRGHTSSLEMLLATVHARAMVVGQSRSDIQHRTLVTTIQSMCSEVMQKLGHMTNAIAQNVRHCKALLESSAQVVQSNMRIFQAIQQLQAMISTVPPQIERQHPVYLVDALNKECPFHLEFIRSAEALLSVLKVNLKESGCGPGKIDRGEFVIEDCGTHAPIDMMQKWDLCFHPGQRVAMSMVFQQVAQEASCPRCRTIHAAAAEEEVTCTTCGIIFRRIEQLDERPGLGSNSSGPRPQATSTPNQASSRVPSAFGPRKPPERCWIESSMADMAKFRRLRIITNYPRSISAPVAVDRQKHWARMLWALFQCQNKRCLRSPVEKYDNFEAYFDALLNNGSDCSSAINCPNNVQLNGFAMPTVARTGCKGIDITVTDFQLNGSIEMTRRSYFPRRKGQCLAQAAQSVDSTAILPDLPCLADSRDVQLIRKDLTALLAAAVKHKHAEMIDLGDNCVYLAMTY